MKIIVSLFLVCLLIGCAHDKNINGQIYEPKGIVTASEKDPTIKYNLSTGNVILSVVFGPSIVVPVVLCGWYLWEPAYALSINK